MSSETNEKPMIDRAKRYQSHALVDFRKYKRLPFGVHSGVLLDLSTTGFKMAFTGEVKAETGKYYWISIPLSPLGIMAPERFTAKIECKWFDEGKYRIGGVFVGLNELNTSLLEKVITTIGDKGGLSL